MPAPYPVAAIANAFLNKARADHEKLSAMKLQKLIYYAAGYYLAAYKTPLIDRAFEAWDYGPVVPAIYHEFKSFGNKAITSLATEYDWEEEDFLPVAIPTGDARAERVIDFVWKRYGKYSALELSDMTHAEGSPWALTKQRNPGIRDADIPNDVLRAHFEPRIVRKKADA